jgi:Fur family transcriptional regulator, peroxide stress response regulator
MIIITDFKSDMRTSEKKIKMTRQRRVILNELQKSRTHPAADEIYKAVRRKLPHISLGTVYRNLEILSQAGMIVKLDTSSPERRFDGRTDQHYHIRCQQCGKVEDVPLKPLLQIEARLKNKIDYDVSGHNLEFRGLCHGCKENLNK